MTNKALPLLALGGAALLLMSRKRTSLPVYRCFHPQTKEEFQKLMVSKIGVPRPVLTVFYPPDVLPSAAEKFCKFTDRGNTVILARTDNASLWLGQEAKPGVSMIEKGRTVYVPWE